NKVVEEALYPAMEDFCLDIVLGKGPSARTVRLELPKFSLIAATTRIGLISSPMRDRFGAVYRLNFYIPEELANIIKRSAKILNIPIDEPSCNKLAQRSRGTPREANRLVKRIRDFAQIKGEGKIDEEILDEALKVLEIDNLGLDKVDRDLLKSLCIDYRGGPVGLDTLAATIAEDAGTVEDVIEPYLIQKGMLKRSKQGRMATRKAFDHLKISVSKNFKEEQKKLF
ncbi:MAG TPA: Holliday junction branch migration DNA helicase RuvB, partial [Candidatus Bathyarchaeia archaeon]|nr:Holliday junction branch migration DNA helicase RuvB [Candidatus Bathyarchaeia archaeon]